MKVVGLLSGGKDSCYNLCHCAKNGHQIVALATLVPPRSTDELDSYMYQTVGHDAVHLVAAAMQLPLYRHSISGTALNQQSEYGSRLPTSSTHHSDPPHDGKGDETEDLYHLLLQVKRHHPDVEAVSVGAILSNYQRVRVEHVALRASLSLLPLAFLWQRSQPELYDEMIRANMTSILIKVAGIGLEQRDLGKTLHQMRDKLWRLHSLYGAHVCGEGGEYETLTLDSPLFKQRIEIVEIETVVHSDSGFGSVSYLRIKKAQLVDKELDRDSVGHLHDVTIPDPLDRISKSTLKAIKAATTEADSRKDSQGLPSLSGLELAAGRLNGSTPSSISLSTPSSSSTRSQTPSLTKRGRWLSINNIDGLDAASPSCPLLEDEVVSAFRKVQTLLSGHTPALDLSNLTHINLYLSSQSLFPTINEIYKRHFGSAPPTRACVAVRGTNSVARFHLSAVGFDDVSPSVSRGQMLPARKALHVQGRSYWAPANIGPYSQAVTSGERIWIAGQIGLRPPDLTLPSGAEQGLREDEAVHLQCTLAMQHARRIFEAVLESRCGKGWVEGGVCWLDEDVEVEVARRCWAAQLAPLVGAERDEQDAGDDDNDDEEEGEEEKDVPWLRSRASSTSSDYAPPLLFASLPAGHLPRAAKVEWQLTAHTGRSVPGEVTGQAFSPSSTSDDEDEQDDVEADLPTVLSASFHLPSHRTHCTVARLASIRGGASFGIMSFHTNPHGKGDGGDVAEPTPSWLQDDLQHRAFATTLLYTEDVRPSSAFDAVRECVRLSDDRVQSINCVPVSSLYAFASTSTDCVQPVSFALVWHGV